MCEDTDRRPTDAIVNCRCRTSKGYSASAGHYLDGPATAAGLSGVSVSQDAGAAAIGLDYRRISPASRDAPRAQVRGP
jgi:hypothetical protein